MRGLKDRTVLVTGGANGIGAATARRLAEEGCAVGILDMDVAAGADVAGGIEARGLRAKLYDVDITDYDAVARAVESFEASFGPVSFLVNNAGWDRAVNFLDTAPDFWRKVVAINLFGPLNVTHVVLRGMAARGFGRVVNVASDAGRVGSSGEAVYSACKGGIIALTKTLARELVGKGVILNTIAPARPIPPFCAAFWKVPTACASPKGSSAPSQCGGSARLRTIPGSSPSCCPMTPPTSPARPSASRAVSPCTDRQDGGYLLRGEIPFVPAKAGIHSSPGFPLSRE